jgi:hypothetical protein
MSRSKRNLEFDLPRSIPGRCVFGAACVFLLPLSAAVLCALLFGVPLWPVPAGAKVEEICVWLMILTFVFLFEYMSAGLFIFSLFGLIWSIARPEWTERVLQIGSRKMVRAGRIALWLCIGLMAVASIVALAL